MITTKKSTGSIGLLMSLTIPLIIEYSNDVICLPMQVSSDLTLERGVSIERQSENGGMEAAKPFGQSDGDNPDDFKGEKPVSPPPSRTVAGEEPKSAQELADEWHRELEDGLDLIKFKRPRLAQEVQAKKVFESIPTYLNVLVGNELATVKELRIAVSEGEKTTATDDHLSYWLEEDPAKLLSAFETVHHEQAEHQLILKFLGDNHTPKQVEDCLVQVQWMIHNSKKHLFGIFSRLHSNPDSDEHWLRDIVEKHSKQVATVSSDKLSEKTASRNKIKIKGQLSSADMTEQNGKLKKDEQVVLTNQAEDPKAQKALDMEEEKLKKEISGFLEDKLSDKEARGVYELIGKVSKVHITQHIQETIKKQERLDELFKDLTELHDGLSPPMFVYKMLKEGIQAIYQKITGTRPTLEAPETGKSPLRLSSLWTARSASDLDQFGLQVQLFQNTIHQHLLALFFDYMPWYRSHSSSCTLWIENSQQLLEIEEIKDARPEFIRPFITQLEEAGKIFKQLTPQ